MALPLIASQPHFYLAEPSATSFFRRFQPHENDATTIDVEPVSRMQGRIEFFLPELGTYLN